MLKYADVEDQYKCNSTLKKADVLSLLEWACMQPHLPKISELEAALFLHSCYGSNQAAKECIDNHYTCRTHCPEFFANCNPESREIQAILDAVSICVLPKTTPKNEIIFYARLNNTNPDFYNFNAAIKVFDMIASLQLHEFGCYDGHVIIVDVEGTTLMHILKTGVLSVKKYLYYLQDALPFRLKGFHYVNGVSFMDKILGLVKPFMKKELQEQLFVHYGSNETIFKHIPKDCLPKECGGDGGPLADIFANQRKRLESNTAFFSTEEKKRVDESQRPGKPKNAGDLFGVEGTFKKLDID